MSTLDYLIALHCTVSNENNATLGFDESPIIRIDWALVNSSKGKIVEQRTFMVHRPEENGFSSHDGSEPDDVVDTLLDSKHEELHATIHQIEESLLLFDADELKVQLITDGPLHLRQCLHPRAAKRNIQLSKYFYEYFDLRKEYKKYSGKLGNKTALDIASDISLDNKKGYDDPGEYCRMCAKITQYLIRNGHNFEEPEFIMSRLEPGMSVGFVRDETIVRTRGLPWQVSDHDVANFFKGLNIVKGGVALCLNFRGRRNGEALVRFEKAEHRDLALKRHKHHLSGRYIEVYKGSAQDFLKIAQGPSGAMNAAAGFLSNGGEVIIRMRGLPYSATAKDILDFFGDEAPVYDDECGIMFVCHPDGSATGDAFVLFSTEDEGKAALKKHREKIGSRYVELFRSTQAEVQQVLTMYNVGFQFLSPVGMVSPIFPPVPSLPGPLFVDRPGASPRIHSLISMCCLRLRGLPFSATKEEIIVFLGGHATNVIGTVQIIYNLQGRPSGEAFVQLRTSDQAHKASNDLHLKHMGERYIEVFQCSIHDMNLMLATSHANLLAAQQMNTLNNNYCPNAQTLPTVPLNGLLSPVTNGLLPPPMAGLPPIYNGQYHQPMPPTSPGISNYLPAHSVPLVTGTVVRMRGLPYNSTAPDIFQFFGDYKINPESLHLQMNQYGKPNGVAYVTFATPEEAQRAIQEKNKQTIGNRYVELFLA